MLTRPLKIAHVALSLDVGGLERNIINQIRLAPELRQEVSVVCLERPGALAAQAEALGARVVSANKKPGLRPSTIFRLRKIFRDLQPDIIHTHQIGPLFYTRFAAGDSIVVHTEHGKEAYAASRKLRMLGRCAARAASIFYCLSQEMADAVISTGIAPPDRVRLIHNGIDFSAYTLPHDTHAIRESLNIPHDAPLVGTIGRLTEIKRQDVLLKAFAALRQHLPSAHLLLVGDGPLLNDLGKLAAELNIAPFVHFAGYQQNTAPYMQAMNVFALTSRSEGMPQSLLEAAVARIPIIASNVGGIPEVIQHDRTGFLFEAGDQAALAAELFDLLTNRDRAATLARAAHEFVQSRFDIRRMAAEYDEEFRNLLSSRTSTTLPVSRASHSCVNHQHGQDARVTV